MFTLQLVFVSTKDGPNWCEHAPRSFFQTLRVRLSFRENMGKKHAEHRTKTELNAFGTAQCEEVVSNFFPNIELFANTFVQ